MRDEIERVDCEKTEVFSHRKVPQVIRFRVPSEDFSFFAAVLFSPLFGEAKSEPK